MICFILIYGFDDQAKKKQRENLIRGFGGLLTQPGKYPNFL